jgi:RHS repeat-associated protein
MGSSTPPGPQALLNNKKAMDAGSPTAQTAVTAVYTWGAAGLVSENISWLASTGNPGSLFYAYYPNGATLALTDINGAGQDVYLNSAYGEQWDYFGAGDPNPFQFGGQAGYYTDQWSTLGFTLCGARWYVPNAGFWLNRDPAGYAGGPNLYAYCNDDPLADLDPGGDDPAGRMRRAFQIGYRWGADRHRYMSTHSFTESYHCKNGNNRPMAWTDCGRFVGDVVWDDDHNYPEVSVGKQWAYIKKQSDNYKSGVKWTYGTSAGGVRPGDVLIMHGHTAIFMWWDVDNNWVTEEASLCGSKPRRVRRTRSRLARDLVAWARPDEPNPYPHGWHVSQAPGVELWP